MLVHIVVYFVALRINWIDYEYWDLKKSYEDIEQVFNTSLKHVECNVNFLETIHSKTEYML